MLTNRSALSAQTTDNVYVGISISHLPNKHGHFVGGCSGHLSEL